MKAMLLLLLPLAAAPASAQTTDPAAEARQLVEAHKVGRQVPCSVPMPAVWNAPAWEQEAAARRRQAFNDCLDGVMEREQNRLQQLTAKVDGLHGLAPDTDWSGIDAALDAKWSELDEVESKLRIRENWAKTAVSILDTFTGPGAPFDSSPMRPGASTFSPYGYGGTTYNPVSPYPYYRRDSSTSAPGIK